MDEDAPMVSTAARTVTPMDEDVPALPTTDPETPPPSPPQPTPPSPEPAPTIQTAPPEPTTSIEFAAALHEAGGGRPGQPPTPATMAAMERIMEAVLTPGSALPRVAEVALR